MFDMYEKEAMQENICLWFSIDEDNFTSPLTFIFTKFYVELTQVNVLVVTFWQQNLEVMLK